jgi:hypothetical protein
MTVGFGPFLSGPPVVLTLTGTAVIGNSAMTSPAGTAQGGGVSTTQPVAISAPVVAGNKPDQCFGYGAAAPVRNQAERMSVVGSAPWPRARFRAAAP